MHSIFDHRGFTISYHVYGSGPQPVLAFHGFGVDSTMWKAFAEAMGARFTFVCVDVIFHGRSSLPEDRTYSEPLQYTELSELHLSLMHSLGYERFWCAGYSMGGRLALGMIKQDASWCDGLLLFAPDGLVHRPWYRGLAHSKLGYRLYDHWVEKPGFFNAVTNFAFRTKLIDERLFTFLSDHASSYDRRALVRSIWFSLRHIEPELDSVVENLKTGSVETWLFVGKFDSIIRPSHAKKIRALAGEMLHFHVLNTGHAMIFNRTGEQVMKLMERKKGKGP